MAGFSGATGVPLKQMQDAIAQSTAYANGNVTWNTSNVNGNVNRRSYQVFGKVVIVGMEFTPLSGKIAHGNEICSGLPIPKYDGISIAMAGTNSVNVTATGSLVWYWPEDDTNLKRVDFNMVYMAQ